MTDAERKKTLEMRRNDKRPWHSPPHKDSGPGFYLITATCYEHKHILATPERLRECSTEISETILASGAETTAWCVLPNHYHFLVYTEDILNILSYLKRFHGRKARTWNIEDGTQGRKVFHSYLERFISSEEQLRRAINYVHHNPVKHGYVQTWHEWPFSSAHEFIAELGQKEARHWWLAYPIGDFGNGWDD